MNIGPISLWVSRYDLPAHRSHVFTSNYTLTTRFNDGGCFPSTDYVKNIDITSSDLV